MFKQKISCLLIILCVLFTLSVVSAADNTTDDNNGELQSEVNISTHDKSFTRLSEIINNSTESEIKLDSDYIHSQGDNFPDGIKIDRNVTIDGQGHVIDANKKTRIFMISSKNITLKNIKFINNGLCYDDFGGMIIFSENSTSYIFNCNFTNHVTRE